MEDTQDVIDVTPTPKPTDIVVKVSDKGEYEFSNHIELRQAADKCIQTKLAPASLIKEGVAAVATALLACKQFNLPQKSMSGMAYIKGNLTFYGYLVLGIAKRHPLYGEKEQFFLDKDYKRITEDNKNMHEAPHAAVVKIKQKNGTIWNEYFFTWDDAVKAGLVAQNAVYKKYPRDMLMHKALKRALYAEYADSLEGIDYHEDLKEVYDMKTGHTPNTYEVDVAAEINKTLS